MPLSNANILANPNKFVKTSATGEDIEFASGSGGAAWGDITGTLSAQTDLQNALDAKMNNTYQAFPVGSVFISVVVTNPNTLLGYGTWSAFGAGKVLVGIDAGDADFDTVEETGGAKTAQSSAQTFAGSPSTDIVNHTHVINGPNSASGGALKLGIDTNASGNQDTGSVTGNPVSGGVASYTPAGTNTPGAATSVVQPYIVVYMWKRTV